MARAARNPAGRNVELAKIHMGAAALGMITKADDSAYRDMLWSVARVRSAGELDAGGRAKVIEHLQGCGWKDNRSPARRRAPATTTLQAEKIRHLWQLLHQAGAVKDGSERALRAYTQHQSKPYHPKRFGYSAPELLPAPVAQRVIEHLKHWCRRLGIEP